MTKAATKPKAKKGKPAGKRAARAVDIWKGNPALRDLLVPIAAMEPDPENLRTHSERNIRAVAASLQRHGQQRPVVLAKDGHRILAGNATREAAIRLGWTHLAGSRYDGPNAKAYGLVDNRAAELAEWNYEILAAQFRQLRDEGIDLAAHGWEAYEVETLLSASWPGEPGAEDSGDGGAPAAPGGHALVLTAAQHVIVEQAVALYRQRADAGVSEGACLALIAAEWLRDPNTQVLH